MTAIGQDTLGTRDTLNVGGKDIAYYSLKKAAAELGDQTRAEALSQEEIRIPVEPAIAAAAAESDSSSDSDDSSSSSGTS